MEYITSEQFLEQPEEVQKVLKEWWCKNHHSTDLIEETLAIGTGKKVIKLLPEPTIRQRYIPLFTEGQLRKFIDEKTGGIIAIKYLSDRVWWIKADDTYSTEADNLLQAYWQVACEVAKEV